MKQGNACGAKGLYYKYVSNKKGKPIEHYYGTERNFCTCSAESETWPESQIGIQLTKQLFRMKAQGDML